MENKDKRQKVNLLRNRLLYFGVKWFAITAVLFFILLLILMQFYGLIAPTVENFFSRTAGFTKELFNDPWFFRSLFFAGALALSAWTAAIVYNGPRIKRRNIAYRFFFKILALKGSNRIYGMLFTGTISLLLLILHRVIAWIFAFPANYLPTPLLIVIILSPIAFLLWAWHVMDKQD